MSLDLNEALDLCREGRWDEAHQIVQKVDSRAACWLHAIIHREEGDLSTARYWYSRASRALPEETSVADELADYGRSLSSVGTGLNTE